MLDHSLAATERPRDESGTAFGDRIERVYAAKTGLHDLPRPRFLPIGLDGHLDRPFLRHVHKHVIPFIIYEDGDDHVDVVHSGGDDLLDSEISLEGERNHDLVGKPSFLDLSEPVGRLDLVTWLGYGGELPKFPVIQGIGVLSSLEEHALHGRKVVLESVVHAGKQAGTKGDLEHPAFEFHGIPVLETACALEHLDRGPVAVHLDDFGKEWRSVKGDVAEFVFSHRAVHLNGHQVGDDSDYFSFSLHLCCSFFCLWCP